MIWLKRRQADPNLIASCGEMYTRMACNISSGRRESESRAAEDMSVASKTSPCARDMSGAVLVPKSMSTAGEDMNNEVECSVGVRS